MSDNERTPGPIQWEDTWGSGEFIDDAGDAIAYVDCLSDADAAFIEAAWNNFDALLAVCEMQRDCLELSVPDGKPDTAEYRQLVAAIAKAKGE